MLCSKDSYCAGYGAGSRVWPPLVPPILFFIGCSSLPMQVPQAQKPETTIPKTTIAKAKCANEQTAS